MHWWQWLILVVANAPLYVGLSWLVFDSWEEFWASLRHWISPEEWSWLRGERPEDLWADLKLLFWLGGCGLAVGGEYLLIDAYLLGA